MLRTALALLIAVPLLATTDARADDEDAPKPVRAPREEPFATKSGYANFFVTAMGGTGLRFDNPYRLSTPLGGTAESVSRTAAYVNIGLGATLFGNPLGFQHGISIEASIAVEGISQVVMTPAYLLWRRRGAWAAFGRAGIPIVASPDLTWGLEGAVGGAFFFLGGLGVVAEIVGDVIYGTGTRDIGTATYPILSGQLGLIGNLEVLP